MPSTPVSEKSGPSGSPRIDAMVCVGTLPPPVLPSHRTAHSIRCAMLAVKESSCCMLRRLLGRVGYEIHLVGRVIFEALVRTASIVKAEIARQCSPHFAHCFIGVKVNVFILHAAPQSFDKNIVHPAPFTIHAHAHTVVFQHVGKVLCGELTALIGVEN